MSGLWFALSCLLLTCCSSASLKEPAASSAASCPPCTPAECAALPARGCPLGKVRDSCGCCWQCARGEGEACGMGAAAAAAAAGPAVGWGRCAAGLECRRRRKGQAGVCVCKSRYPVCGTDGLTYPSACQLRAASLRSESRGERPVEQRNKGPCEQGPSIVTPPKDTWNVTGAQLFLSCEVIGVPTPVLTWNKITRGQYGVQRMELLPGDRDNLAIQTRGGPEKHEVTGWVLISPLSKDDAGEYECHALNSKGEATASARINVVNSLQEIPTIKGESTEL
ncbi:insulin-like growth factor-binding protein 7 isoform X2 [Hemicordylus capensis]|uniref:insulin-like growth factor-binding protein 7 isoform X2 n=1 Tax=Hemicordylus capensis TaxID=884348 RepID=UPI00230250B6|nr:insulin-like growth factor-binding protein 7 isoform X2 [Hemicordylus capensis]